MAKKSEARERAVDDAVAAFRQATGAMFAHWRKLVRERGTTPPQMWVIRILVERGRATSKELAEEMCVTPANITGLVAKLERHGFVSRTRDRKDRRIVRLEATPKAKLGLEAMKREARARAAEAFDDWSTADIEQLTKMLRRLGPEDGPGPKRHATAARRRQPRRP